MAIKPNDINIVIDGLKRSKVLCLQSPPRSGKSTYVPMAILKEVLKDNPDGNVIVLESTFEAVKNTLGYLSRHQKPGLIDIHRNNSLFDFTGKKTKLLYMTPEAMVNIYLDMFLAFSNGEEFEMPIASVVIINDAYLGNAYINLFQYLWYESLLKGIRTPRLLLTSTIPGFSMFVRDMYPTYTIKEEPPEIQWSRTNSKPSTVAGDIAAVIKTKHVHNPLNSNEKEGWVVFVATRGDAFSIEKAINEISPETIIASVMPSRPQMKESMRSVIIITPEFESSVPWNYVHGVFDSMYTNAGNRSVLISKNTARHRSLYGKFCRRMITEEHFESLPASTQSVGDLKDYIGIAVNLTEINVPYSNFMKINNVPEFKIARMQKVITELDLIINGEATPRGQYVSYLGLDPHIAVCIYELITNTNFNLFAIKYILVTISVAGMEIFRKDPEKFCDSSDLMVIVNAICNYINNSNMSLNEWCKLNDISINHMNNIDSKVNDVTSRLLSLNPQMKERLIRDKDEYNAEEIIDSITPTILDVYYDQTMKSHANSIYHQYISPSSKRTYVWKPRYPPKYIDIQPAQSVIAFKLKEWLTQTGINRVIVLGHPINNLKKNNDKEIDMYMDLLKDL